MSQQVDEVRAVLQQFQDGYTRRDEAGLDAFMDLFVPDAELEVIGTGGIRPGEEEWPLGKEMMRTLVHYDWEGWGDLALDVAGARIHVLGDVAWLATRGTVSMVIAPEKVCADFVESIREVMDATGSAQKKVHQMVRRGANVLEQAQKGEQYTWPIRFTAVLVRRGERWLFHQMQYSYATITFPDVRE